jgi:Uma2 family endonuclease
MVLSQKPLFTVEAYLALEREAEERHEYLDGVIYAMAGESPEHGTICTNLTMLIATQLRGTPCQAWSKDTKVRSGPTPRARQATKGLYSYPDLVIVCGEAEYHDQHRDVLLNPAVVIEVLSPATEAFDRGEKLRRYQTWNPTLSDYSLVSQDSPFIAHYTRQADGGWAYYVYQDLKQSFAIKPIGCLLRLADIYDRITFPAEAPEPGEEE